MPSITRSLAIRLTLAFVVVGITGALLVALVAGQRTQREFNRFVDNRFQTDVIAELSAYYRQTGSWEDVDKQIMRVVEHGPRRMGRMRPMLFTIVDSNGMVVFSRHFPIGQPLPRRDQDRALPIIVDDSGDDSPAGWVLFEWPDNNQPQLAALENEFLTRMFRAILFGALGAASVALLLGVVLAHTLTRPVRELTQATDALAHGALGEQVPVRSTDELGQLATSFNHMSAQLAHSVQMRRQMTADIAHDLRTPLSVILGYTEALADGKIQGSAELYGIMHGEAEHLQHLIEDLRTLSLADAGELALQRMPVSPQGLLVRTAAAHGAQAQNRQVELLVDAPDDLPPVQVDPDRMAQVLGNLVSNALRHTPAGGRVTLAAVQRNGNIQIKVADTGEGISPEDLPHIFDRFYRGDPARVQHEGESGLGLAIAKSLVEAHKGVIEVSSRPGSGTTFTIQLPV